VLAKELTREAVIDAYEKRRFYATENTALQLDFRCAGYPMGSRLQAAPRTFTVKAGTAPGESFEQIRLYRDGALLQTQNVSGNPVEATFSDPAYSGSSYYYVIVTETVDSDGNGRNDEAISSPIWLEGPPPVAPSCGTLNAGISGASVTGGHGDWAVLLLLLGLLVAGRRRPAVLRVLPARTDAGRN
jgi:MYXO-CTERM domain-containing protein